MSTQTPDFSPKGKAEKASNEWLESAKQMPEKASAEFSQGAEMIREKVHRSAKALRDLAFVDHICQPPKML